MSANLFSLAGRTALVTGASSGLGEHFATVLASAGAAVVVAARRTDRLEVLRARIEAAGFIVLVMHIADIRAGLNLEAVLAQHDPKVIVYDVVAPYERNWRFFEHLRDSVFAKRQFVLTSPNEQALRRFVGRDESVYEIIEGTADIDAIVQAVREAARARPTK